MGRRNEPLSRYVKMRIEEWVKAGKDLKDLARKAHIADSAPSQLRDMKYGVGGKTLEGLAVAFGMKPSELLQAAEAWWEKAGRHAAGASPTLVAPRGLAYVPNARYENLGLVLEVARRNGEPAEAIEEFGRQQLDADEDLQPREWQAMWDLFLAQWRRRERSGDHDPGGVIVDDDDRPLPAAVAPTPPKKKRGGKK